jgi:uncharacterized protein YlxW (UPF0749 family)
MVSATIVLIGLMSLLVFAILGMDYLMYVRLRELQEEVESLRSKVEITDNELDRLEASLRNLEV